MDLIQTRRPSLHLGHTQIIDHTAKIPTNTQNAITTRRKRSN